MFYFWRIGKIFYVQEGSFNVIIYKIGGIGMGTEIIDLLREVIKDELSEFRNDVKSQFEEVGKRFNKIDNRFEEVNIRLDNVDIRLSSLEEGQKNIERKISSIPAQ